MVQQSLYTSADVAREMVMLVECLDPLASRGEEARVSARTLLPGGMSGDLLEGLLAPEDSDEEAFAY